VTVIRYNLPPRVGPTFLSVYQVSLKVYDLLGRQVATLVDGPVPAGTHTVRFDGSALSSGLYYYMLREGEIVQVKKMLILR
jgi:hypothetical protein